jgi:hypothetical protein
MFKRLSTLFLTAARQRGKKARKPAKDERYCPNFEPGHAQPDSGRAHSGFDCAHSDSGRAHTDQGYAQLD